jgi:hypothetical protein
MGVREFETEVDASLAEAETALFEARGSGVLERRRRVAAALRRAADAMERFAIGDQAYDAEELRRLAVEWERGYPDAATYASHAAILKDVSTRVVDAGRPPELDASRELGAPEAE